MINNDLVFCSGNMDTSYAIMNQYINSPSLSNNLLQELAIKYHNDNSLLEIVVGKFINNKIIVYQISSYNNFEIIEKIINGNDIGLWSAGIKTADCFDFAYKELINKKSIQDIYQNTFNKISFEGIGGQLSVYKLDKNFCKLFYQNNIKETNINLININAIKHNVVAERLYGQIVASVNLIVSNDAGNFTVNSSGVTVQDMDLAITHTDNLVRIIANTTDCFKIQCNSGTTGTPIWNSTFAISSSGTLLAEDLVANRLIVKNSEDILIDAYTKTINFTNFTTIAGVINADNINLKGLSMFNDLGEETLYITSAGNLTMQGILKSSIIQAGVIQGMTSGATGTTGLNLIYFGDHGGCIDTYTDEGTGYQALRLKPGVTVTGNDAGYVQYIEDGHIYFYDNSGSGVEFAQINPDGTTTLKTHSQITEVTESTTLTLSHANRAIKSSSASPIVITVPPYASVPFLDYTEIEIINYGSGGTSIVAGSGVTIVSKDNLLTIDGQYSSVALKKLSTDEWLLVGALA